jgi:hypothetical protein
MEIALCQAGDKPSLVRFGAKGAKGDPKPQMPSLDRQIRTRA